MISRHLTSVIAASAMLIGAWGCSSDGADAISADGFAARSANDTRWGIVDRKGQYALQNAYDNPPSAVVNNMYTVENSDGEFLVYNISSPNTPINASPLEQVTAFYDDFAFATRRGTPIFIVDRNCNPLTVLPDTVWEVRLTGDRHTVAAYRDNYGHWGILNPDGSAAEQAQYPTYEEFCAAHPNLFMPVTDIDKSLMKKFAQVMPINPFAPVGEKVYAVKTHGKDNKWMMVNGLGENIGDTDWRDYAFTICRGREAVVQQRNGNYNIVWANDGKAGTVSDLAFSAVSCRMSTSVKSGRMYPSQGCKELCNFLININLNQPDSVSQLIPLSSDAGYYHLTSVTFPEIMADVDIAKSHIDKTRRLMAIVKITPEGNIVADDDFHRMLRNLMFAIEGNIEQQPGWERVGGESHALKCEGSRYMYIIPYENYLVAIISTDRLDYKNLMGSAMRLSRQF